MKASRNEKLSPRLKRPLITRDELAEYLGCSHVALWKWGKDGMPQVRAGRFVRYDLGAVLEWLKKKDAAYMANLQAKARERAARKEVQ